MWQSGQATDHKDLSDQIRDILQNRHVATVVVNAGGTGYAVDDIVTVAGGTVAHGLNSTLRVTAEAAGVITGVRVETGGAYTVDPGLVANAATGAGNDDATFDLTMAETGWTVLIDENTFGGNNDHRVMVEGANGGVSGDEVYVGWRTSQGGTVPNDFYQIRASYATGFNNLLDFVDQPGFLTAPYMNCQNNVGFPVPYWIQATDRHFTVVCRAENASFTTYGVMSCGLFNTFTTQDQFPYPIYIYGGSPRNVAFHTANSNEDGAIGGLGDFVNYRDTNYPFFFRDAGGVTRTVASKQYASSLTHRITQANEGIIVFPCGEAEAAATDPVDDIVEANFAGLYPGRFAHPLNNVKDGAAQFQPQLMPDTPDDLRIFWPLTITSGPTDNDNIFGEIPGAFWVYGSGLASEDVVVAANGDRYRCFRGGRRTQDWAFFGLKEE